MRKNNLSTLLLGLFAGLTANTSYAIQAPVNASNASGVGNVVASETVSIPGKFTH